MSYELIMHYYERASNSATFIIFHFMNSVWMLFMFDLFVLSSAATSSTCYDIHYCSSLTLFIQYLVRSLNFYCLPLFTVKCSFFYFYLSFVIDFRFYFIFDWILNLFFKKHKNKKSPNILKNTVPWTRKENFE